MAAPKNFLFLAPSWHTVVSVTLEWYVRMMLLHPPVERIVEKHVSQHWTNNTTLLGDRPTQTDPMVAVARVEKM